MHSPFVSLIIVTWNCREYVLKCLQSVFMNQGVDFEILVRDNGSSDGTLQAIRGAFPHVRLIGDGKNVGFAAANNEALALAQGIYILLLNPDTVLPSGALLALVSEAGSGGDLRVIVPTLLNSDGTLQSSIHRFPTIRNMIADNLQALLKCVGVARFRRGESGTKVDWARGACLLLPRNVMEEIGKLDENLFMYGEDLDYCWRVHRAGYQIVWAQSVEIVHHGNVSGMQKWGRHRLVKTSQGLIYFWIKHFGIGYAIVATFVKVLSLLARSLVSFVIGSVIADPHQRTKGMMNWQSLLALAKAWCDADGWVLYHTGLRHRKGNY